MSFTGFSFGAWLAEQSVYFCFEEFNSTSVKAVTFDSPGSGDIIKQLAVKNLTNMSTMDEDTLAKHLDITTYLFSPSFINTCNTHFGKVYRLIETRQSDLDQFLTDNLVNILPDGIVKVKFEKFLKKIKDTSGFKKFEFYLNGLVTLFAEDLKWLVQEFDPNSQTLIGELREIKRWPKMEIKKINERFENFNIADSLVSVEPFVGSKIPEFIRKILTKPIDWVVNTSVKNVVKSYFSGLSIIFNIVADFLSGNLDQEKCVECFDFDSRHLRGPAAIPDNIGQYEKTKLIDSTNYKLEFQNRYKTVPISLYREQLWILDRSFVDAQIVEFYNDKEKKFTKFECPMADEFNNFRKKFEIKFETDGKYKLTIMETEGEPLTVELVREIFLRLELINGICKKKSDWLSTKIQRKKVTNGDEYFVNLENPSFVMSNNIRFEEMNEKFGINKCLQIFGEPGNGKRTLAREYAKYLKTTGMYCLHHLISSDLYSNILKLKKQLLGENYSDDTKDKDELINLLSNFIKIKEQNRLFIFEDVKKFEDVEALIDSFENSKFIIITHVRELSVQLSNSRIYVPRFDENQFIQYLEKNHFKIKPKSEFELKELYKRCLESKFITNKDVENAVSYFVSNPRVTTFEELEAFIKNESFYRINTLLKEDKKALKILFHLAYIDGNFIDENTFRSLFGKSVRTKSSLDFLMRNGYLKLSYDSANNRMYLIHENIQNDLKNLLGKKVQEKDQVLKNITNRLNKSMQINSGKKVKPNFHKIENTTNHLMKFMYEEWESKNEDQNFIDLLNSLGQLNQQVISNHENARKFYEETLSIALARVITDYRELAECYQNIGSVYKEQEKYQKALENLLKALNIKEEELSSNRVEIAKTLNLIGGVYLEKENYNESLNQFRQALAILIECLPDDHMDISDTYKDIGFAYFKLERYNDALDNFEKALGILNNNREQNLKEIADLLKNIGLVYKILGKHDESLKLFEQSLTILKDLNEGDYAEMLITIAETLIITETYDRSEKYLKEALEIQTRIYPIYQVKRAVTMNYLGFVCARQEKYEESIEYSREALLVRKCTLPPNHPEIAKYLNNLGTIYYKQECLEVALEHFQEALKVLEKAKQPENEEIAETLNNIALVINRQKRYEDALKKFEESIKKRNEPKSFILPEIVTSSKRNKQNKASLLYSKMPALTKTPPNSDVPSTEKGMVFESTKQDKTTEKTKNEKSINETTIGHIFSVPSRPNSGKLPPVSTFSKYSLETGNNDEHTKTTTNSEKIEKVKNLSDDQREKFTFLRNEDSQKSKRDFQRTKKDTTDNLSGVIQSNGFHGHFNRQTNVTETSEVEKQTETKLSKTINPINS